MTPSFPTRRSADLPGAPACRRAVGPVDRHEQLAGALARVKGDAVEAVALRGLDAREAAIGEAEPRAVVGVDFDERLLAVARELGCETRACHRMPLVTITAGVERERPFGERFGQRLLRDEIGRAHV